MGDGVAGLRAYVGGLPGEGHRLEMVRAFGDGAFAVVQTHGEVLGQGDFVFLVATGTHEGRPCLYVDLYRVEGGKLVEHWGFPEAVPPAEESRNGNGML